MITKQRRFLLAIALQLVILLVIILFRVSIITGGSEVFLSMAPIDPRDYLRGDYATLSYTISSIPSSVSSDRRIEKGDTVYVVLIQDGNKFGVVDRVQLVKPIDGELFIKGVVTNTGSRLRISYGIEEYFIPENTGGGIPFRSDSYALVAIDDAGNAAIKQIFVNDAPWP